MLVKQLGLINSLAVADPARLISAFNLVILRNFFMNIPPELLESARIDGANDLWILLRIVLPLSKPVLAVIALFYGVAHWNDFFNATLYLNDADKWPIQLVLRQYVMQGSALAAFVTPDPTSRRLRRKRSRWRSSSLRRCRSCSSIRSCSATSRRACYLARSKARDSSLCTERDARCAHNQVRWQFDSSMGAFGVANRRKQESSGDAAHLLERLADGRQRRMRVLGLRNIVEADNRQVRSGRADRGRARPP